MRDMEFMTHHALTVKGTDVFLPTGLLLDGAQLHEASGAAIETDGQSMLEITASLSKPFSRFWTLETWDKVLHGGAHSSDWLSSALEST